MNTCLTCRHVGRTGAGNQSDRLICLLPPHQPSVAFERDGFVERGRITPKCGPDGRNWEGWA